MTFEKGKSGNPTGKHKDVLGLTNYARNLCPRVFDILLQIAEDESNKVDGRIKAANIIVERGMGSLISSATLQLQEGNTIEGQVIPTGRLELEKFLNGQLEKN